MNHIKKAVKFALGANPQRVMDEADFELAMHLASASIGRNLNANELGELMAELDSQYTSLGFTHEAEVCHE